MAKPGWSDGEGTGLRLPPVTAALYRAPAAVLAVAAAVACGTSAYAVRISHPPAALTSWLIPSGELPHDAATIDAQAETLVQRYPADPRSFELVGTLRLRQRD